MFSFQPSELFLMVGCRLGRLGQNGEPKTKLFFGIIFGRRKINLNLDEMLLQKHNFVTILIIFLQLRLDILNGLETLLSHLKRRFRLVTLFPATISLQQEPKTKNNFGRRG